MARIDFSVTEVDVAAIRKEYFLGELFSDSRAEEQNVALAIKSIYFYRDLLTSNISADVERIICRDALILIYSVMEAVVVNSAENIQRRCKLCRKDCALRPKDYDYISANSKTNSFQLAYEFLEKTSILKFGNEEKEFFDKLRGLRNDVHLLRSESLMAANRDYSREVCTKAVLLMQAVFCAIRANLTEFYSTVC